MYKIITGNTHSDFEDSLNEYCKEGYIPLLETFKANEKLYILMKKEEIRSVLNKTQKRSRDDIQKIENKKIS